MLCVCQTEWQRSPPERWSLAACDEPLREWVLQLEGVSCLFGTRALLTSATHTLHARPGTELYQGETFLLKARTHHCRVQCAVTASR